MRVMRVVAFKVRGVVVVRAVLSEMGLVYLAAMLRVVRVMLVVVAVVRVDMVVVMVPLVVRMVGIVNVVVVIVAIVFIVVVVGIVVVVVIVAVGVVVVVVVVGVVVVVVVVMLGVVMVPLVVAVPVMVTAVVLIIDMTIVRNVVIHALRIAPTMLVRGIIMPLLMHPLRLRVRVHAQLPVQSHGRAQQAPRALLLDEGVQRKHAKCKQAQPDARDEQRLLRLRRHFPAPLIARVPVRGLRRGRLHAPLPQRRVHSSVRLAGGDARLAVRLVRQRCTCL